MTKRILIVIAVIFCLSSLFPVYFAYSKYDDLFVEIKIEGDFYKFDNSEIVYGKNFSKELAKKGIFDSKKRLLGLSAPMDEIYVMPSLHEKLQNITKNYAVESRNAKAEFDIINPKNTKITPEFVGKKLQVEQMEKEIAASLAKGKGFKKSYMLADDVPPVTEAKIKNALKLCGSFSTSIAGSTEDRKHNIALALSNFNGMMFAPCEEFSFNKIVGRRTAERGYREANIILHGELVPGVGGGVCQASTTLYNALLLCDFSATEVENHSLKIGYVPASFDAMVSSVQDLKMKNGDCVAFLRAYCKNDRAVVEVWRQNLQYDISRKSITVFTGDVPKEKLIIDETGEYAEKLKNSDFFVLQSSKPKLKTEGWLIYSKNGKEIFRKKIRQDTYNEQVGTIIVKPKSQDII